MRQGEFICQRERYWLKDFTDECEEFPNGEYDDVVDSVSQFLLNVKSGNAGDYKGMKHGKREDGKCEDGRRERMKKGD